ncbi:MAG: hypothetical protein F6K10_28790, partial [Moorea sp. SIO2B7]|nr:hypothetical protein [Moorena sp. SIO2B7]
SQSAIAPPPPTTKKQSTHSPASRQAPDRAKKMGRKDHPQDGSTKTGS